MEFYAEYRAAREHRLEIERIKNKVFLLGLGFGMVICLGLILALAQFGIYLG